MKPTALQRLRQSYPQFASRLSLATAGSVITANSVMLAVPVWLAGVIKTVSGNAFADEAVIKLANHWINTNNNIIDTLMPDKDWRISLPDDVDTHKQYLLVCNHQSWVDTSVIQYVSRNHLPLTRFFTKYELIYIPIVGQAFYFLDFPMMKRHSKQAIAKNPALKGKDILEAKRACDLLKHKPFTLLNYLEGTRFSTAKHRAQNSPYRHLLKPKAGGLALAISALGQQVDGILDMTVVYPDFPNAPPTYADLWLGNVQRLGVDVRHITMNDGLFDAIKQGAYSHDADATQAFYAWLDELWQQKDARMASMLAEFDQNKNVKEC